MLNVVEWVKKE